MPIYEYRCNNCEKEFEYLLRSHQEKISCPYCKGAGITRKLSTFSFGSKDSQGNFRSVSKCTGCSSNNCSTCSS